MLMLRETVFADPRRDPQIGLADILKQLGEIQVDSGVFFEQQLLKHRLVDGDYLLKMRSIEVHENSRSNYCCT